jgi:hypothetical protein
MSTEYPIVEFRRYTIKEGERAKFTRYFEAYTPEVFQQMGAMFLGEFLMRDEADGFLWMRGFRKLEDRAIINSAFYYGPVWQEHRTRFNSLLVVDTNVLLLEAVRNVPVLPAVDVVNEVASGVVVALIYKGTLTKKHEITFAELRNRGIREAGLLATLDVPNNFPQLPFRTDGPFVVWLGVMPDDSLLGEVRSRAGDAEVIVLDPAPRSRLRWL